MSSLPLRSFTHQLPLRAIWGRTYLNPRTHLRYTSSSAPSSSAFSHSHSHPPPPPPRKPRSRLVAAAAILSISLASYTLGSIFPPTLLTFLFPRPVPPVPLPDSPTHQSYLFTLEERLHNLPLLQSLRSLPDAHEWYETRPYVALPQEMRTNNFTAGALAGAGKLALFPLVRVKRDESEAVAVVHVGRGLCGHEGVVHGGLLASLLDESLARVAINNLPDKVGVTANLNINYRAPTFADQFIVIRTTLVSASGRKSVVRGRIEDVNGTVLVEADATFVQPRFATLLSKMHAKFLRQAMGEPLQVLAPALTSTTTGEGGAMTADGKN